jgi:ADP-ribosylation factor-like protein 8
MAGLFKRLYDYLLRLFWYVFPLVRRWMQCRCSSGRRTDLVAACRATEMDITMIGLQNAGKTSLLRVLAVRHYPIETCEIY